MLAVTVLEKDVKKRDLVDLIIHTQLVRDNRIDIELNSILVRIEVD